MKVFVLNCGSSSIKYQLFDMADESVMAKGLVERIGSQKAGVKHTVGSGPNHGAEHSREAPVPNHTAGVKLILDLLVDPRVGVLRSTDEIQAVGHRVVHGAEKISGTCLIDQQVIAVIRENFALGPVHNPPNLAGIEAMMAAMPGAPNVAVFDTAFFTTLPPKAYRYAVPNNWYARYHVRKYGFHGTSHRYVTLATAELLSKPLDQVNLITVHLGNGCSMTAVAGGKAVDHSMGMTPLDGLVMGTRSGTIDPAVPLFMIGQGLSAQQVDAVLNKQSGLLGLSERSNDMRDLLSAVEAGDERARLAVDMFVYRVVKYIGSYYVILPSVDAVVLTGGIGENSLPIRQAVCRQLSRLGAEFDEARNQAVVAGKAGPITRDGSKLPVWIVPTNEELMIARDTAALTAQLRRP
jgi:acetate kinase